MSRAAVQDPLYGYQSTYSTHMGHPTGLRAGEGRRPSRLLQMRDDYQRRILQEKEEKMVNMYEENQRKNVERVERLTRGPAAMSNTAYPNSRLRQPGHLQPPPRQQGHQQSPSSQTPSSPSLREFFRERRELETKGGYVPQINQHYKHSRSRIGSGNSHHKHSAGVDRGQPLAPIKARHGGVSSAPALPISHRPRLFKQSTDSPDIDNLTPKRPSPPARNMLGGRGRTEKMSDFQQWQMEQNRAREDRLKKLNLRTFSAAPESEDWGGDYEYEDEEEKNGTLQNEALQMQEQELLQRIAKQQAELERLRQQREEEEELERQEAEMLRKQEAAERERRRQQQQEEARQYREEEAIARREEEEHRRALRAQQERRRFESKLDHYDTSSPGIYASQPNSHRSSHRQGNNSLQTTPRYNPKPPDTTSRKAPLKHRGQQIHQRRPPSPQDNDDIPVPGPGIDIYANAVDEEAGKVKIRFVSCKVCGRKFADDRIQKHQNACKNANKKRSALDPTEMRTEGTDMAKYIKQGAHKKDPVKKKKNNWRHQHQEFISNIRYAKQMQQMEQQGVSLKDLPPPPPSHNPDLVPCPHCGRTFNDLAAERHIPRCQELKTRPVANRKRR